MIFAFSCTTCLVMTWHNFGEQESNIFHFVFSFSSSLSPCSNILNLKLDTINCAWVTLEILIHANYDKMQKSLLESQTSKPINREQYLISNFGIFLQTLTAYKLRIYKNTHSSELEQWRRSYYQIIKLLTKVSSFSHIKILIAELFKSWKMQQIL